MEIPKLLATKKLHFAEWLDYKFKLSKFCVAVGLKEVFQSDTEPLISQWESLSYYLAQGCSGVASTELQKQPTDSKSQWT